MGSNRDQQLKRIRRAFLDSARHRLLNDLMAAIGGELQDKLQVVLPPPTGKSETNDSISVKLLMLEELTDDQIYRLREILKKFSNPHDVVELVERRAKGSG